MSKSGKGAARKFGKCVGIRIPFEVARDSNIPFKFDGDSVWVELRVENGCYVLVIKPYKNR